MRPVAGEVRTALLSLGPCCLSALPTSKTISSQQVASSPLTQHTEDPFTASLCLASCWRRRVKEGPLPVLRLPEYAGEMETVAKVQNMGMNEVRELRRGATDSA